MATATGVLTLLQKGIKFKKIPAKLGKISALVADWPQSPPGRQNQSHGRQAIGPLWPKLNKKGQEPWSK